MNLWIFLFITLLLFWGFYLKNKKLKEPYIGYCLTSESIIMPEHIKEAIIMPEHIKEAIIMPEHIKEATVNQSYLAPKDKKDSIITSRLLKKKIQSIRKALEDKAEWEYNKINSYSHYSPTQPNDLVIDEQTFFLDSKERSSVNPVLTQFDYLKKSDNTPSKYLAPRNYQLFNEYGFKTYY
jgi:hypothetical protein